VCEVRKDLLNRVCRKCQKSKRKCDIKEELTLLKASRVRAQAGLTGSPLQNANESGRWGAIGTVVELLTELDSRLEAVEERLSSLENSAGYANGDGQAEHGELGGFGRGDGSTEELDNTERAWNASGGHIGSVAVPVEVTDVWGGDGYGPQAVGLDENHGGGVLGQHSAGLDVGSGNDVDNAPEAGGYNGHVVEEHAWVVGEYNDASDGLGWEARLLA